MKNDLPFIVSLALINIPLYFMVGKLFFKDGADFADCIVFWFKPDLWSWCNGEWWEDMKGEFKLSCFLIICGLIVYGEYSFFCSFYPSLITTVNGFF